MSRTGLLPQRRDSWFISDGGRARQADWLAAEDELQLRCARCGLSLILPFPRETFSEELLLLA